MGVFQQKLGGLMVRNLLKLRHPTGPLCPTLSPFQLHKAVILRPAHNCAISQQNLQGHWHRTGKRPRAHGERVTALEKDRAFEVDDCIYHFSFVSRNVRIAIMADSTIKETPITSVQIEALVCAHPHHAFENCPSFCIAVGYNTDSMALSRW